jgi:hypothetical protein
MEEAIKPALIKAGFEWVDASRVTRNARTSSDLARILRGVQLVIADVTGGNPNVLFEAGMAYGLGRRVLMLLEEGTKVSSDLTLGPLLSYQNSPRGLAKFRIELLEAITRIRSTQFNIAAMRSWLTRLLADDDLSALCLDHFPEVYDQFDSGTRKSEKIQLLLDYCQRRDLTNTLLRAIQAQRPDEYADWLDKQLRNQTAYVYDPPSLSPPRQFQLPHRGRLAPRCTRRSESE